MDNDALLLEKYVRSRDVEAFAALAHRYAGMVYATSLRVVRNSHDAEEVAQECFLSLARKPDSVRSSLPGWLHSLALSRSKDFLKKADRRERHERASAQPDDGAKSEPAWEEIAPLVDQAIADLPDELREPIISHFLQKQSHAEIAKSLGVSRSTVTRRIQEGIEALRDRFGKSGVALSTAILSAILYEKSACATPVSLTATIGKMALSNVGAAGKGALAASGSKVVSGGVAMKLGISTAIAAVLVIGGVAIHNTLAQKDGAPRPVPVTDGNLQAQPSYVPPRPDNAAINYLLAAALIHRPANEEELKIRGFLDEFARLPPEALSDRPDVAAYLSQEEVSISLRRALHEGALKTTCHFDIDWRLGPAVPITHLFLLRSLALEANSIAKHDIFVHQHSQASEIEADLIRMGSHLGEDMLIIQGLVGMGVQSMGINGAEGLLAAEPPREAIKTLMAGFQRVPREPFKVDSWLRGEAQLFSDYFIAYPQGAPGNERIKELSDDRQRALTLERVAEFKTTLLALADAAKGPYYESADRFKPLWARVERQMEAARNKEASANPLFAVMPNAAQLCANAALADARLNMLRILTAAAMWKAETGAYPDKIELLRKYFPEGLPTDPFTGKDFVYSLRGGFPRIEFAPPADIADSFHNIKNPFELDLGLRLERDAAELAAFRQKQTEAP